LEAVALAPTSATNDRNEGIDLLRGVAILLVVIHRLALRGRLT
jgi:peptidoglycan/LPS O-acetylase OafA/YrhL